MPYTYDDFIKAAADAGLTGSFDQSDLDLAQKFPEFGLSLVSLRRDLNNAQTNEQRLLATEAANQLRKNYGSYGVGSGSNQTYASSYGSQIDKALEDIGSYGPFEYSRAGDYKGLLDRLINREAFSYDPGKDPIFSSYKKAYNREGDRAAANALAQSSATTGGRASSYANVAAQQAGNYYAAKLADMIPELRNQALTEYNNDYSQLLSAISTMGSDRDTEFGVYQDRLKQLQQNLANLQGQDASDYARFLDALNSAYQKERDAVADEQTAFENSLKIYQATGQITGPLADILGAGAGTGIGTGGAGGGTGGAGGYRGSRSGNTPTAADAAAQEEVNNILNKWGISSITGQPYTDSNGNQFVHIGSWDEYQRLKELGGWSDAELNQAGISYGYPTTTDENGNLTPAVAYTPVGGTPQTWEQVDAAGGNYQAMVQRLQQLKDSGASKAEVLEDIRAFYQAGQITSSDYQRLYNQYRNMNASEFGTGAANTTPSTSGRSTGAGTVKPGTRTPSTASTTPSTPAYDSRGIPWAYSPDNPANKSSGTTKSTTTTTKPSTSTSSSTTKSTGGGLLSSLAQALKNAAGKANTNPYAGYNTDPVTNANMNGSSNKSTSSSSTKSTSSTKSSSSGSSKSSGTVKAGTRTPSTTSTTTKKTTTTTTKKTASGGGGAKRVAATR